MISGADSVSFRTVEWIFLVALLPRLGQSRQRNAAEVCLEIFMLFSLLSPRRVEVNRVKTSPASESLIWFQKVPN